MDFEYRVMIDGTKFEFDRESELLQELFEIAKSYFVKLTDGYEDVGEIGYPHLAILNWIADWELNNSGDGIESLIVNFNDSMADMCKIEWIEDEEETRKNLLDLTEEEFVSRINPFKDTFEFQFDNGYKEELTVADYLLDRNMEKHVLNLIDDDDKEVERDRLGYFYSWKMGRYDDENMKWFWFVLGDITQGFDSEQYKIYFV